MQQNFQSDATCGNWNLTFYQLSNIVWKEISMTQMILVKCYELNEVGTLSLTNIQPMIPKCKLTKKPGFEVSAIWNDVSFSLIYN